MPEWLYVRYLALDALRLPWERSAPSVVVSHESAADVLGIGALPADAAVFTSERRRTSTLPGVRVHVATLPPVEWEFRAEGRLPVTSAARTVIDLALLAVDRDYVERALDDALYQRLTTVDAVAELLPRHRGRARKASIAWLEHALDARRERWQ